MKKWIDDIEKQIDAIEAGEVDAKNLSEVLDKDAPIKLTTDLQNNKVKVGLDIDSETLEVNNGKLKVKAGGGSGTKKYLHTITVTDINDTSRQAKAYTVQLILNTSQPLTDGRTFAEVLLTLPTIEIRFGGMTYGCIVPIINSTHTMSSDFKQIKRAIWIINLTSYVGIAYTTTNLTDGTIDYYYSNGYTIDGNAPYPQKSSVYHIVTEL